MLIKTIMNRIEKHKSFIYTSFKLVEESEKLSLEVGVEPRKNNQPICSGCQTAGPTYDHLPQRRFQYVPLWGIEVILLYVMRRVSCPNCGIKVEQVPWGRGKSPLTRTYSTFLAIWARRLSWQEVADVFGTSWNRVYEAVKWAVSYGLKHRDLNGITECYRGQCII